MTNKGYFSKGNAMISVGIRVSTVAEERYFGLFLVSLSYEPDIWGRTGMRVEFCGKARRKETTGRTYT
jgi:hypothetical protein